MSVLLDDLQNRCRGVGAFSPNIKFIVASCCSKTFDSVHHSASLYPVVVLVLMDSFHNHSDCSPGSPCFRAGALCLIPVCKESRCNTNPVTLEPIVAMAVTSLQS